MTSDEMFHALRAEKARAAGRAKYDELHLAGDPKFRRHDTCGCEREEEATE
jgi:hypothetical protein